jgi:hypothetical protein
MKTKRRVVGSPIRLVCLGGKAMGVIDARGRRVGHILSYEIRLEEGCVIDQSGMSFYPTPGRAVFNLQIEIEPKDRTKWFGVAR